MKAKDLTLVQQRALRQIADAGHVLEDGQGCFHPTTGKRVPKPSVDAFLRKGILGGTATLPRQLTLTELGKRLASELPKGLEVARCSKCGGASVDLGKIGICPYCEEAADGERLRCTLCGVTFVPELANAHRCASPVDALAREAVALCVERERILLRLEVVDGMICVGSSREEARANSAPTLEGALRNAIAGMAVSRG